jgi:hypothetical protein
MLKYLLIFLFLIKVSAGFAQKDSADYKLYALILDSISGGSRKIVVRQECTTTDFKIQNEEKIFIKSFFPKRYHIKILSDTTYNLIFHTKKGWDTFYKMFKGYGGLYSFSPVLYEDKEHTKAEIYVDHFRGDLDGEGFDVELILINGKWQIKLMGSTWMA